MTHHGSENIAPVMRFAFRAGQSSAQFGNQRNPNQLAHTLKRRCVKRRIERPESPPYPHVKSLLVEVLRPFLLEEYMNRSLTVLVSLVCLVGCESADSTSPVGLLVNQADKTSLHHSGSRHAGWNLQLLARDERARCRYRQ